MEEYFCYFVKRASNWQNEKSNWKRGQMPVDMSPNVIKQSQLIETLLVSSMKLPYLFARFPQ
jgi:hypothetical protein